LLHFYNAYKWLNLLNQINKNLKHTIMKSNSTTISSLIGRNAKTGRFESLKVVTNSKTDMKAAEGTTATPETAKAKAVKILTALYGQTTIKTVDVTDKVTVGGKITNKIAGEDPCPKKKKSLYVTAEVDGEKVEKTFSEGQPVIF
jgi:predicted secreted protein